MREFHRPERVVLDPVSEVRRFANVADREVAGLLAASLAYGSLSSIRRSVQEAIAPLGEHPAWTLDAYASRGELVRQFRRFRHRWTSGRDVADLLWAIRCCRRQWGCLEKTMFDGRQPDESLRESLARLTDRLRAAPGMVRLRLLPNPRRGSACKRLLLFLRWMVRQDVIDPGGWTELQPKQLLIPLDVHTFHLARQLGLTRRRTANWSAAEEITARLSEYCADDPVRYDFALAHAGAARHRITT